MESVLLRSQLCHRNSVLTTAMHRLFVATGRVSQLTQRSPPAATQIFHYPTAPSRNLWQKRGISTSTISRKDTLQTRIKTEFEDVLHLVSQQHCVICTGQYYNGLNSESSRDADETEDVERYVVCTLGNDLREPYGTSEVADIVLPSSEGSEAIEHHLLVSGALAVHRGEMDFFDQGPWNYGSFTESTFHVFTPSAAVVRVGIQASGPSMILREDEGKPMTVPFGDISTVAVELSDDWAHRSINFELSNGSKICAVQDIVDPEIVAAAKTPEAAIMTTTEWLVKTAGGFVLQLRRAGHTAKLVLPKILTAAGNSYVAQRNAWWAARAANRS
eukprot:m.217225 g.217225  ORF g.217225 m.217225 type:complete len:331 (+) comp19116_c0_seq5:62-1054(+)